MPPFLFGASVGASGTASKGDNGGACGTVSTVVFFFGYKAFDLFAFVVDPPQ